MKTVITEFHKVKSLKKYMAFKVLAHTTLLIILICHPHKPFSDFFSELNELLSLAYAVSQGWAHRSWSATVL